MGIPDLKAQLFRRLESKTLDHQFEVAVRTGLGCSPFEAKALLDTVHEVYGPYMGEAPPSQLPGCLSLMCVDADEPAGKPVEQCELRPVTLRMYRDADDLALLDRLGPMGFRRARLPELCQEALSQGGLLTREDLAYRVFWVSVRTVSRDFAWYRQREPDRLLPIRSHLQDIGPVLTHREKIVRLALEGRTTTQICQIMHHSPAAVANYLQTFSRCAFLVGEGLQVGQIAYLLRRGPRLVEAYVRLLGECEDDRNLQFHLHKLLQLGEAREGGKISLGGSCHGR